jgi:hypothetical protein
MTQAGCRWTKDRTRELELILASVESYVPSLPILTSPSCRPSQSACQDVSNSHRAAGLRLTCQCSDAPVTTNLIFFSRQTSTTSSYSSHVSTSSCISIRMESYLSRGCTVRRSSPLTAIVFELRRSRRDTTYSCRIGSIWSDCRGMASSSRLGGASPSTVRSRSRVHSDRNVPRPAGIGVLSLSFRAKSRGASGRRIVHSPSLARIDREVMDDCCASATRRLMGGRL